MAGSITATSPRCSSPSSSMLLPPRAHNPLAPFLGERVGVRGGLSAEPKPPPHSNFDFAPQHSQARLLNRPADRHRVASCVLLDRRRIWVIYPRAWRPVSRPRF